MITFEQALEIVLNQAVVNTTEFIFFQDAPGRVLASAIVCDRDIPPFDKSAMDGYACKRSDLDTPLKIVEVIRAGIPPVKTIGPGECSQIMTGAILPDGADTVVKVEEVEKVEEFIRFIGEKTSANICFRGEDMKAGNLVLEAGTLMGVRHVPILATVGATSVEVYRKPAVGVMATGTELVEPDIIPGVSQIRNSNAHQMIAQLRTQEIKAGYYGIAPDDEDVTRNLIGKALKDNDIVILSGGVSMGEFDFVPSVLESLGINILFQKIAIQPGKPTLFGTGNGNYVFGLPGNPVSSYILFELLIRPFIYKLMGYDWKSLVLRLKTGKQINRKHANRMGWLPVRIDEQGKVFPVEYHGSAHILALKNADGIIPFPIGKTIIEEGESVDVRSI
ncbi:MAG: gephyrin-like molybdotransferase Glp [Bacteroidota bacterium]